MNARQGFVPRLIRRPAAIISLSVIVIVTLACAFAGVISPYDPITADFGDVLSLPTAAHPLGTDALGRDLLSRLLWGGRVTLTSAAIAVIVALAIGIVLGLLAGYSGKVVDRLIMGYVDTMQSFPSLIILLVVLAVFTGNITAAMIALGVILTSPVTKVVRAASLTVRNELYVDAATVSGLGRAQIILRHILPRVAGPVIVQASLLSAVALIITSSLGFLGLGTSPPNPTWGSMIFDASYIVQKAPWQLVPAGATITILVLCFGVLGDVIRDTNAETWAGAPRRRRPVVLRKSADAPVVVEVSDRPAALLEVRSLTVEFGAGADAVPVIEHIDFDVHSGEILGIVGESGSGKTVTARSVIGLLRGTGRIVEGSIRLDGRQLVGLGEGELTRIRGSQIGFVPQEPIASLDPAFRIGQQLAEVVRLHTGVSGAAARARAVELLAQVRIAEPERVARLFPHQISGGMAQRVSIARALAGSPKLLIADEPTSALDVTVQGEILALLKVLQRETGMAVVLITHDWNVVTAICERAIVMYAGQVVEQAPVDQLLPEPLHPYSRGLLLADPRHTAPGGVLPSIPGTVPKPKDFPVGCHFAVRCPFATEACTAAPVPLIEVREGRVSRCIHWPVLVKEPAEVRA